MRNTQKIETDRSAEFFLVSYRKDDIFSRTKLHRCHLLMKIEFKKKIFEFKLERFLSLSQDLKLIFEIIKKIWKVCG